MHNDCNETIHSVTRVGKNLIPGKNISIQTAISRLKQNKDIITESRNLAKKLQRAAAGGKPIFDKPHGLKGYLSHYHGYLRNTGHAFFK